MGRKVLVATLLSLLLLGCGRLGFTLLAGGGDAGAGVDGATVPERDAADLDGAVDPRPPTTVAAFSIDGLAQQWAFDLAYDRDSNLVVGGMFDGATNLGGVVTPSGTYDGFVASYDGALNLRWAFTYGSDVLSETWELDQAANGRVYATGIYRGALAEAPVPESTARQAAVRVELDPNSGTALAGNGYFTTGNTQGRALDTLGDRFAVGGVYIGDLDLGLGNIGSSAGNDAGFVAVWDTSAPDPIHSVALPASDLSIVNDVALASDGSLCVVGQYAGDGSFGAAATLPVAQGSRAAFVTRLSPAGVAAWVRVVDTSGGDQGYGVVTTSDGDCVVTGYVSGTVDLGTGTLPHGGGIDAYLARFDAVDGTTVWASTFNSAGDVYGAEVAVSSDEVFVTGVYSGELAVGEATASNRGAEDVYIAAFDLVTGAHRWLVTAGGSGSDGAVLNMGLAVSPDERRVAVCGGIDSDATFGETTLTANDVDAFVWVLERP